MNSDSLSPNVRPDSHPAQFKEEDVYISGNQENNPILPEEEVENVLNFLESAQNNHDDTTPHFISSLVSDRNHPFNLNELNSHELHPDKVDPNLQTEIAHQPMHTEIIPAVAIIKPTSTEVNRGENLDEPSNDDKNTDRELIDLVISKPHDNAVLQVVNNQTPVSQTPNQLQSQQEKPKQDIQTEIQIPTTEPTPPPGITQESQEPETLDQSSIAPIPSIDNLPEPIEIHPHLQVQFKTEGGKLQVILPSEAQMATSEYSWSEIWQQFQVRLKASDRLLVADAGVHLDAKDRLLDGRQLQELADTFKSVKLNLQSVTTSRRQTAIAAVTAGYSVEQTQAQDLLRSGKSHTSVLADPIYLETTVRSGVEIRHPGTVIVMGDVNPGGIIVADGDILIWGRLRGVAHAGAGGNRECLIMALQMEPTQLRIADAVARAPEKSPQQFHAEVAHITSDVIRITRASDFSRAQYLNRIDPSKFNAN